MSETVNQEATNETAEKAPERTFTQAELDEILAAARAKVAAAKEYAVGCEYPDESEFYKDVYVD